ncbi:MAG: hypothetical protein ACMUIG_01340 [Thermoplasmatota archaeon]
MRTFALFDPKIYSLVIFKVKKKYENKLLDTIQKDLMSWKGIKVELSYKEGWTILEIIKEVNPGKSDFVSVSPDIFKLKFEESKRAINKAKEIITPYLSKSDSIHVFNLFTSGVTSPVWIKSQSDVSFLYLGREVSGKEAEGIQKDFYQSNISYLNRLLNRHSEVMINSITHSSVTSYLYLMGKKAGRDDFPYPTDMMLEINMSGISSTDFYMDQSPNVSADSPYATPENSEKDDYLKRQNYLISLLSLKAKLLDLFLLQSEAQEKMTGEIVDVKKKGSELKEKIYSLQNKINEHMQKYVPQGKKKSKAADLLDKDTYETEKALLTSASVHFSLVSEIEHEIMRYRSLIIDIKDRISDKAKSMSLSPEAVAVEGKPPTIGDMVIRELDNEYRVLTDLTEELSHSRNILSSTIDVLRTFIDTRQREVSENMSRLMNMMLLVFACIGLADALGNFVILVIEHGFILDSAGTYSVIGYSMAGMILTIIPLMLAAIFLYFYFKKI